MNEISNNTQKNFLQIYEFLDSICTETNTKTDRCLCLHIELLDVFEQTTDTSFEQVFEYFIKQAIRYADINNELMDLFNSAKFLIDLFNSAKFTRHHATVIREILQSTYFNKRFKLFLMSLTSDCNLEKYMSLIKEFRLDIDDARNIAWIMHINRSLVEHIEKYEVHVSPRVQSIKEFSNLEFYRWVVRNNMQQLDVSTENLIIEQLEKLVYILYPFTVKHIEVYRYIADEKIRTA